MRYWTAELAAEIASGTLLGDPKGEVRGCIIDSRQAKGGEMFFALPGEKTDGHDYIETAWQKGAALAIADRNYFQGRKATPRVPEGKALVLVDSVFTALQVLAQSWRRELNVKVVGVTGSNGKTTTKDMIYSVLGQEFRVHCSQGNHNNELGLPMTILNAPGDTEILILEMGMRGLGEIKALCEIARPDIGVITNIGTTHMELLLSQERIAQAKWELIEALPEGGTAIINADDLYSVQKAREDRHKVCFYGLEGTFAEPHIKGSGLRPSGRLGTTFTVTFKQEKVRTDLSLPGTHNVLDALAALAVGTVCGVSLVKGCRGLRGLEMSKMRLELRQGCLETTLINDVYNANPVSMQASLKVLRERAEQNKTLAILGDMYELGDSAESGHQAVGKFASQLGVNYLITVGKLAADIAQGALQAGYDPDRITITYSREAAAEKALELLKSWEPGTWVLIKGSRGMRMEEITALLER